MPDENCLNERRVDLTELRGEVSALATRVSAQGERLGEAIKDIDRIQENMVDKTTFAVLLAEVQKSNRELEGIKEWLSKIGESLFKNGTKIFIIVLIAAIFGQQAIPLIEKLLK